MDSTAVRSRMCSTVVHRSTHGNVTQQQYDIVIYNRARVGTGFAGRADLLQCPFKVLSVAPRMRCMS